MHNRRFEAPSKALYNVFVRPIIYSHISTQPRRFFPKLRPSGANLSHRPRAFYTGNAAVLPSIQPDSSSATKLCDEQIGSLYIHLVDAKGKFHPPRLLTEVLDRIDRSTHQLVQVAPPDPRQNRPPTCKILAKSELPAMANKSVNGVNIALTSKQMEMNWAIDATDLSHRMKQLVEFLDQGRQVEVTIMPKRHGRKASSQEAENVLQRVKEAARSVQGVEECKAMEGKLGSMLTLCFESREKRSQKRMQAQSELQEKLEAKKMRLQDPSFEKKVMEKKLKFDAKRLQKAKQADQVQSRDPPFRSFESGGNQQRRWPAW